MRKVLNLSLNIILLFVFLVFILSGACKNNFDTIKKSEILNLPSITVRDDTTVFTDSGKIQLILTFPVMETYDNSDLPYSEFKSGIQVQFYEGHKEPVANVSAKYAKYTDKKKLWELKDSVIVINETADKLETEQLFWDQDKDLIYTERLVKITNADQTVIGTGFESDPRLNRRKIKNVSATIYLRDGE